MAIDTKSVSQLIAEFRKLQAKDAITPAGTGDRLMSRYTLHIIAFRDTDLSPSCPSKKDCASASLGYDVKGVPLHTLYYS